MNTVATNLIWMVVIDYLALKRHHCFMAAAAVV